MPGSRGQRPGQDTPPHIVKCPIIGGAPCPGLCSRASGARWERVRVLLVCRGRRHFTNSPDWGIFRSRSNSHNAAVGDIQQTHPIGGCSIRARAATMQRNRVSREFPHFGVVSKSDFRSVHWHRPTTSDTVSQEKSPFSQKRQIVSFPRGTS